MSKLTAKSLITAGVLMMTGLFATNKADAQTPKLDSTLANPRAGTTVTMESAKNMPEGRPGYDLAYQQVHRNNDGSTTINSVSFQGVTDRNHDGKISPDEADNAYRIKMTRTDIATLKGSEEVHKQILDINVIEGFLSGPGAPKEITAFEYINGHGGSIASSEGFSNKAFPSRKEQKIIQETKNLQKTQMANMKEIFFGENSKGSAEYQTAENRFMQNKQSFPKTGFFKKIANLFDPPKYN